MKRRCAAVLVTAVVMAMAGMPVALAAPANDRIGDAVVVGSLPFVHTEDTTGATTGAGDPTGCSNQGSVWFRFTPSRDMTILADTFGSDYDTVLSAFVVNGDGSLTQIACNDDADGLQSRVHIDVSGGRTYYFMVGVCCGNNGSGGGELTFHVRRTTIPVLRIDATADAIGYFDRRTGEAVVSGEVRCNAPATVAVYGSLVQRRTGILVARGDFGVEVECAPPSTTWEATVAPNGDVAFGPGDAVLRFAAQACNDLDCAATDTQRAVIRLRHS
jgi:hypothetical protein